MIATTLEQSNFLRFKLDQSTADMVWRYKMPGGYSLEVLHKEIFETIKQKDIPAWSLTALLEVMPTTIEIDGLRYDLELFKAIDDDTDLPYYGVRYVYNDDYHLDYYESGSNIIEQAFAMVCILLENGYIKKGGNNE